jgi:hypothetical protein
MNEETIEHLGLVNARLVKLLTRAKKSLKKIYSQPLEHWCDACDSCEARSALEYIARVQRMNLEAVEVKKSYLTGNCIQCKGPNSHVSGVCQKCRTIVCARCEKSKVVREFHSKYCGYCSKRISKERINAAK